MKNELVKVVINPVSIYFIYPFYLLKIGTWTKSQIRDVRKDINKVFESDIIENIIVRKEGGKLKVVFFCNKGLMTSMKEISSYLRNELNKPLSGGVIKSNNHIHIWKES